MALQHAQNPVEAINNKINNENIGRLFAVVHLCGKQFKITDGDIILVEGYWEPKNGDKIRLNKVNWFIHSQSYEVDQYFIFRFSSPVHKISV